MRPDRDLLNALAALAALSLVTVAIAAPGVTLAGPALAVAALLILAGIKAEIILSRYLGLSAAPPWRRGFRAAVILLLTILYALWLIPLFAGPA